ncbi:MAG: acetyl-CoA carboxylase biotin carboxyl carrier protein [Candidatus Sumerlaeia bacterium]|nr:acetyl-CoA carboxylase biotin carboxyl carrier protein [Candidatus Sumerlaeia bacterium]
MSLMKKSEDKGSAGLTFDEIKQLVELVDKSSLTEVELEVGNTKIRLSSRSAVVPLSADVVATPLQMIPQVAAPSAAPQLTSSSSASPKSGEDDPSWKKVTSPMVGTFYRAPSPSAPNFANIGDQVRPESVLCIIEAMKLMNEIKAEYSGTVVKVYVENGQPVEYGQPIFAIKPN